MDNVLLLDLETSPNVAYSWHGKWEVNLIEFIEEGQIICFSWKWLGQKEIGVKSQRMYKGYKPRSKDNSKLITDLNKLLAQAEYVVGHNLVQFDDRVANTDILLNELVPPQRHRVHDTLKIAKKYFRFNSNSLDDLAHRLGVGRKLKHAGFPMWKGCLDGDKDSWDMMEKYNRHDIVLLEGVYNKFLPWVERPALPRIRK